MRVKQMSIRLKWGLWTLGFLVVLSFWWNVGHYPIRNYLAENERLTPGTFGDSFGFINSLFSSMGFLVATAALIMQIDQTNRTIEIANDAKEDEKRRRQAEVLMGVKADLSTLFRSICEVNAAGGSVPIPEAIINGFRQTVLQLDSTIIGVAMIFGDDSHDLRNELLRIMKMTVNWTTTLPNGDDNLKVELQDAILSLNPLVIDLWNMRKRHSK